MSNAGRSLELFFIDGRPDGMLTAHVFNWTGHVLRAPRTQIKQALERKEAAHTGVYILLGDEDGEPLAYIGEAEELGRRIRDHARGKEWWDTVVLVTTTANNLHKAHIKYLEARLVEIARSVATTPLENGNTPPRSSLSEADQANMEGFIDRLAMVLPAIGMDMFLEKKRKPTMSDHLPNAALDIVEACDGVFFEMAIPRHGIAATALVLDGDVIVKAGSKARIEWIGVQSHNAGYAKLFQSLIDGGILSVGADHSVFTSDYAFSSPSAAAAIISGRAANGRTSWLRRGSLETYADWEASRIDTIEVAL